MDLLTGEQCVELAGAVECVQFIAAADRGLADENLRKGRTVPGAVVHLLTKVRVGGDVQLGERGFFSRQQALGGGAIAAAGAGEDFDSSGHDAPWSDFRSSQT